MCECVKCVSAWCLKVCRQLGSAEAWVWIAAWSSTWRSWYTTKHKQNSPSFIQRKKSERTFMLKKVFQHHAVSKNTTICPGLPSVHVKARHCCNSNDYMAAFKQSLRALSLKKQRMRSKAFTLFHIGNCFDKLEFASVQASLCPISELSQLDWIWMVSNQPNPLIAFLKKTCMKVRTCLCCSPALSCLVWTR